jgi:hypothetical protein
MKIPTALRTPNFVNVIIYASTDVYILTAADLLVKVVFVTVIELCTRQLH